MNSNEWMKYSLGEICSFISGTAFPRESQNSLNGTIPFIKVSDLNTNGNERWIDYANNYISESEAKKLRAKIHPPFATTFAKIGIALTFNRRRLLRKKTIADNNMASAVPNKTILDSIFLYYLLLTIDFNKISSGTALPYVNLSDLERIPVDIPPLSTQRRIAEILSALDDKIELNRQTNATLEAIAQAIFKEWFVDFNFPSATGEMVESELGMIPEGWRVGKLEEIITNFDRKRVPLSSRERENRKGAFPYYGAASILDYVDDYLFDGVYLLMGEDGTVITEDGKPVLQYVSGKFWVNNHTHVLQGRCPFSTEYVLLQLKNTNVKHIVTGAVQPKINQGNMNELPVVIPDEFTLLSFQDTITPIFSNILDTEQETSILTGIRENLLPKLMNGEIEV